MKIRRLDDDRPAGEGEILVRTDEASSEFIGGEPVPVDEDGWFATGDVGRLDEGILYITSRVQEKIIFGGFNVYPAEVEDVARRSALATDAVVVGLPDSACERFPSPASCGPVSRTTRSSSARAALGVTAQAGVPRSR